MSDLKFRIWDGNNRHFIYPDVLELDRGLEYQQFTGLFDKQGVKVYEGDIAEITNPKCQIQKKHITGVVVFLHGSFGFEIKGVTEWGGYYDNVEPPNIVWFLNIADFDTIEVIGNIYEGIQQKEEKYERDNE